ncbi:ribose 5-phosphate isomerase A [Chitinophaga caeni]|uniref:Ribose-5-phosphate isomerase A n=1 Tax=Chitinophaga caeni TaxID=2029983 RepID=A0A291QRV2_9BACT|nr:ribose-5-phosphate isomerase RpiA [Chitinophaga caeni]ATL46623.1 ribose 5-phosphate isomerase A [Chitinophaga caeni]
MEINLAKKAAGEKAAEYVESGMNIGLGTGSTVYYTILKLGEQVKSGMKLKAIATSLATEKLAKECGIPIVDFSATQELDLTIDGADEVDGKWNLIKGGGGALMREKIVAAASREFIVVVDASKKVDYLGKFPLPVEVIPFGWEVTLKHIKALCRTAYLRTKGAEIFVTDNNNYIVDMPIKSIISPKQLELQLREIPGVAVTGLFIGMASKVIVGETDGKVVEL